MVTPELIAILQAQAGLHAQASADSLAISLWLKSVGYKGPHKEIGEFSMGQREELRRVLKLIRDYAGKVALVPATAECACDFESMGAAYQRVYDLLDSAEAGWNAIVSLAETAKCLGIEAKGDEFLERIVDEKMRVSRALELLDRVKADEAAILVFAGQRE